MKVAWVVFNDLEEIVCICATKENAHQHAREYTRDYKRDSFVQPFDVFE